MKKALALAVFVLLLVFAAAPAAQAAPRQPVVVGTFPSAVGQNLIATTDGISPTITSVADPPCPGTPTPPHCTNLAWTPSTDGVNPTLAYNIYRGTTAGGESATPLNASPIDAGCSSTTTCVYVDTTVSAGATYYYTAKATLNGGLSAASNEVSAQIPIAAPVLSGTSQ